MPKALGSTLIFIKTWKGPPVWHIPLPLFCLPELSNVATSNVLFIRLRHMPHKNLLVVLLWRYRESVWGWGAACWLYHTCNSKPPSLFLPWFIWHVIRFLSDHVSKGQSVSVSSIDLQPTAKEESAWRASHPMSYSNPPWLVLPRLSGCWRFEQWAFLGASLIPQTPLGVLLFLSCCF